MATREDFFAQMSLALRVRASDEIVPGPFQPGQVKVRLVEAHTPESGSDGSHYLLSAVATSLGLALDQFADDLFLLRVDDLVLAVDCLDSRFWQVHSTSAKDKVDRLLQRMLTNTTQLDSAWIPRDLLREVDGTHRWLKSSFDGEDLLGPNAPARKWRARFEGDAPDDLLDILSQQDQYARASALEAIGSTVTEEGIGSAQVTADWRGSFIIGQGDFNAGASVVARAADRYATFVTDLEQRHQLRFVGDAGAESGITLDGDVAALWFDDPIDSVELLVDGLFAAKAPFRLWAVPRQVDTHEWEANAIDLHVGQPLRLEISPYRVRVVLTETTCGNTLARLLTNLQQHLDARVRMVAA
jgi:hypothetical protein